MLLLGAICWSQSPLPPGRTPTWHARPVRAGAHILSLWGSAQVIYVGVQEADDQTEGKWRSQCDCGAQAESTACLDFTKCENMRTTSMQVSTSTASFFSRVMGTWCKNRRSAMLHSCCNLKQTSTREWYLHKRRLPPWLHMYRASTRTAILQLLPFYLAYLQPWQINRYSVQILPGYPLKKHWCCLFSFNSIPKPLLFMHKQLTGANRSFFL